MIQEKVGNRTYGIQIPTIKELFQYLVCGYYREWNINGTKNTSDQIKAIQELTRQMEMAATTKLPIIMMGDMNLCALKWTESDFGLYLPNT